ncbi:metallophosphoesterase [Latilactobacillus graminis]|uniref:Phosphoesterase n=2 Tax=Latilactobacillus graminis TaxID=60519 RepID=A0AA89I2R3_9LACO|nr:metallophosphoesterase [Latilactobacillus graminis]KRM24435.1 phosphoesterase [Latilactobacillus graminis DSM 20719]QFP80016.1 metallophosphatase [Latilactobacillus graminis]
MIYFTADTHFFHTELLGNNDFAPRPFKNVAEMNATVVANWNRRVKAGDQVYLLGDIAMVPNKPRAFAEVAGVLAQLNGQLIIIKGNHDSRAFLKYLAKNDGGLANGKPHYQFADVGALIKINHHQFFLTHYPLLLGKVQQTFNLHGHIHHYMLPIAENINVGIDAPERELLPTTLPFGTPLAASEIERIFERKQATLAKHSRD